MRTNASTTKPRITPRRDFQFKTIHRSITQNTCERYLQIAPQGCRVGVSKRLNIRSVEWLLRPKNQSTSHTLSTIRHSHSTEFPPSTPAQITPSITKLFDSMLGDFVIFWQEMFYVGFEWGWDLKTGYSHALEHCNP